MCLSNHLFHDDVEPYKQPFVIQSRVKKWQHIPMDQIDILVPLKVIGILKETEAELVKNKMNTEQWLKYESLIADTERKPAS